MPDIDMGTVTTTITMRPDGTAQVVSHSEPEGLTEFDGTVSIDTDQQAALTLVTLVAAATECVRRAEHAVIVADTEFGDEQVDAPSV